MSRKRPWIAVVLALVMPGLGHAYLRAWVRAMAWFGLALLTTVLLVPAESVPASGGFWAGYDAVQALPVESQAALLVMNALNAVDAFVTGRQQHRRDAAGEGCPACGRELDDDLDFCPWCTTRLEEEPADSAPSR